MGLPDHKDKPRFRFAKKTGRILIGTTIICVGLAFLYKQRVQPSFKRTSLVTAGNVVVEPRNELKSSSDQRAESALPSSTLIPGNHLTTTPSPTQGEKTATDLPLEDVIDAQKNATQPPPVNPRGTDVEEQRGGKKESPKEEDTKGRGGDGEHPPKILETSGEGLEEEWEGEFEQDDDEEEDFLDEEYADDEGVEEEEEKEEGAVAEKKEEVAEKAIEPEKERKDDEGKAREKNKKETSGEQHAAEASKLASGGEGTNATLPTTPAKGIGKKEEHAKGETVPTLEECKASYAKRRFLDENEEVVPPILYSFPGKSMVALVLARLSAHVACVILTISTGSGNTWTRLLIDISTGVHSGTLLAKRPGKVSKFEGQGHCSKRVSGGQVSRHGV